MKKIMMILLALLMMCGCTPQPNQDDENNDDVVKKSCEVSEVAWYDQYRVIGHAFGYIDGLDYTNSLEAFEETYAKGTRVFEIDMQLTTDGQFALIHEWDQYHAELTELNGSGPVDSETFRNNKLYGKYTPMFLEDVLELMQEHCDMVVVIDSKTFAPDIAKDYYAKLAEEVAKVDPQLLKRFVPQAYTPDIYNAIEELNAYDEIIFTLYAYYVESDGQKVYDFAIEKDITIVVMHMDNDWAKRVIRDVRDYAVWLQTYDQFRIYIHTVNDPEIARSIVLDEQFTGIYTDAIGETEFAELIK